MRTTRLLVIALAATVALTGCATYEARPLDGRAELAALAARGIPDATVVVSSPEAGGAPGAFDPANGLDEHEAVALALTLNTDLQAARAGLGESDALLIQAGVLPNPELGVTLLDGLSGTPGFMLDADLLFELLVPGERKARVAAAKAQGVASRAEVLAAEYELATLVRKQVFTVLAAGRSSALLDNEAALRSRAINLLRARRDAGEGNDLDTSAAELELAEAERDRRAAALALQECRLELNRLMGLPPAFDVPLTDSERPLSVALFDDPSDEQLRDRLLAGRLDLRGKEAEYQVAEQELRLAILGQYPRFRIGPAFEHDGVSDNFLGLGASVSLPIFDRNQGVIAEKAAARDRVRAEYTALLHRLTADAFAARARARAARAEIEAQEQTVLPVLERSQNLFRAAFEAKEVSVLDWIAAQERAVRSRRAYLDSVAAYRLATIDLDAATGLTLALPPPAPAEPPASPGTSLDEGASQ